MDTLDQTQADFTVVLSSDLISEVMERYFNTDMFKMQVKVVDLQAKGDAYAFNLAFVGAMPETEYIEDKAIKRYEDQPYDFIQEGVIPPQVVEMLAPVGVHPPPKRTKNGKFTKVAKATEE